MASNHLSERPFEDEHPMIPADDSSVQSSTRESEETTTNKSVFGETKAESSSSDHISSEGRAAVYFSKCLVLAVLAVAAGAVGYATFVLVSHEEQMLFETEVSGVKRLLGSRSSV
jgi:hypothetical protein